LAPTEAVIVPIWRTDEEKTAVMAFIAEISAQLRGQVRFHVDDRDHFKPGWKYSEWELKGVPLRLEVGPRDVGKRSAMLVRRDNRAKQSVGLDLLVATVKDTLAQLQEDLFQAALANRAAHEKQLDQYDQFKSSLVEDPGFIWAHWCGSPDCEASVSEETKATIRLMPFDETSGIATVGAPPPEAGACIYCGSPSRRRVLWGKSY
jgi:prolyl-tRNA synthetase